MSSNPRSITCEYTLVKPYQISAERGGDRTAKHLYWAEYHTRTTDYKGTIKNVGEMSSVVKQSAIGTRKGGNCHHNDPIISVVCIKRPIT